MSQEERDECAEEVPRVIERTSLITGDPAIIDELSL